MPASSNLAAYEDIKMILDSALEKGLPMLYTLSSPNAAIRWRARAYHFRKRTSVRDYQSVIFRIEPIAPNTVVIDRETVGVLHTPEGEEVEPRARPSVEENLAAKLGIKL